MTGGTYCPHCRDELAPLPPRFLAQLADWTEEELTHRPAAASSGVAGDAREPIRGRTRRAPSGKHGYAPRLELIVPNSQGGLLLPGPRQPFRLLLGAPGRETEVMASVSRAKNTPTYFLASVQKQGARAKLSDELNELGYTERDDVLLERVEDGAAFAIRPTARPREQTTLIARPGLRDEPKLARATTPTWSPAELRRLVAEYDAGSWRGKGNVELDRTAYRLFAAGLAVDTARLVDMLAHVGEFYGGAYRPEGPVREQAAKLAAKIELQRAKLADLLRAQAPLVDRLPNVDHVVNLLQPFHTESKTWFVWGAKFLHFLRPDTFPIIDRRIELALGLRQRVSNTPGYLVAFCKVVRKVVVANHDALWQARREGPEHAEP
ncbi:MAG: hypothetical protein FJ301_08255, partial [Planctomycetes bacterium]|nr:hypothetical protein [Planctomycetota bacterium]